MNISQSAQYYTRYLTLSFQRSKPPEQIYDLRRESTIAEEHAKDVESKFWATYKEVANEYDDDFLERANDDMAIILTFVCSFLRLSIQV